MATTALGGNEVHTIGDLPAVGSPAPKFELIGSILSLLNIEDLATTAKEAAEGVTGFRYRRIAGAGRLQGGQIRLEEGVFESPSASMAANGAVRLADWDTKMTVLVAPFGRVDRVVRGIATSAYTAVSVSRGIATLIYGRRKKLKSLAI